MIIVQELARRVKENIAQVIVGKDGVVELLLVALFCEGHVLLEDVPGIGKTTLAKMLARSLGCDFQRVQFTPDLLPSDITGVSVFNQKESTFEFRPGPIMTQILLADEINRAGPRTQSALLEAMEERQVTVDGVTRPLRRPFLVLATQNPVEMDGTFPLPEAQVDRFLMRVALGYPTRDEEREILQRFRDSDPAKQVVVVASTDDVLRAGALCRRVYLHPALEDYILDLVGATRAQPSLALGVSPRGSLALQRTSQALAATRGRDYVVPDDIKHLVPSVLAHRLLLSPGARLHGTSAQSVLADVIKQVAVPVEEIWQPSTPRPAQPPAPPDPLGEPTARQQP